MNICLSSKNGVKSRKKKRCDLCGEIINVGDLKDTRTGVDGGDMWTMHMHPECHAYEQIPGIVDEYWYDDIYDKAFERKDAIAAYKKLK